MNIVSYSTHPVYTHPACKISISGGGVYLWDQFMAGFFNYEHQLETFKKVTGIWHTGSQNLDPHNIPAKVTLDISGSPIDFQWGSQKYPG